MSSEQVSKIFVIGGTGAQGMPVVQGLVNDKKYHCKILTRDTTSQRAKQLVALGNVELVEGTFSSEADLRNGYQGCDGAFINIDGFNCGEKTELYWAIRSYELALESGIKFFVYGNLDYAYKKSGYDPKCRAGHYDGKGRVGEWILTQTKDNASRMGAALFTTGPYIEMCISKSTIMTPKIEDGVLTWRLPIGDGAVAHVSLEDCAYYVRWLFDHPARASGMDLEVAIDHIRYSDLAAAFEEVTGHKARFVDIDIETYWKSGPLSRIADYGSGYNSDPKDPAFMTMRENFTAFWNIWRLSGGNRGVIRRNYELLDEIHPKRIRSVKQWLLREEERGHELGLGSLWDRVQQTNMKPVLKLSEDGNRGRL